MNAHPRLSCLQHRQPNREAGTECEHPSTGERSTCADNVLAARRAVRRLRLVIAVVVFGVVAVLAARRAVRRAVRRLRLVGVVVVVLLVVVGVVVVDGGDVLVFRLVVIQAGAIDGGDAFGGNRAIVRHASEVDKGAACSSQALLLRRCAGYACSLRALLLPKCVGYACSLQALLLRECAGCSCKHGESDGEQRTVGCHRDD
mmetsp:Transcript_91067/g.231714  ORF Transcript_91067/g.231714 Transcript_91067/m.231714 type:complete len:202 (+) Transcript_91067:140-745(+)